MDLSAANAYGVHPVFPFPLIQFEEDDANAWEKLINSVILPGVHKKPIPLEKMLQHYSKQNEYYSKV